MASHLSTPYDLLAVTGPTATGKTALAAHLAYRLEGEVISADSRQVYRHMDIGTGKDLEDYLVEGTRIPVHLVDIAEAGSQYNVFEYQRDFLAVMQEMRVRDRFPVLCGGSGLYLDAVLKNYRLVQVPHNESLRHELAGRSLEELTLFLRKLKPDLHNITDIVNEKTPGLSKSRNTCWNTGRTNALPPLNSLVVALHFDETREEESPKDFTSASAMA